MERIRLKKNPNVAIVGSTSLLGKELKEMIEESEFPNGKMVLLETEEYAGLLQEFAGQIQITQIISPDAFDDVDIAFFACSPEIMNSYMASGATLPELTIDLTQTDQKGALFLHGISDPRLLAPKGHYINPHPATIVLTRVLARLHAAFGVESAAVTIIEPASERGNAGVDELQEQTVSLLNFQQVGSRTFNGQIAFNILKEETSARTEERILKQLSALLADSVPSPTITAVQAPVFHSHSFSLFLRLIAAPAVEAVHNELRRDPSAFELDMNPSPVGVVGTDKIHIGRISQDLHHPGAYSLWIVADTLRLAASNAMQTAENIIFAPTVGM